MNHPMGHPTWVEISKEALKTNIKQIRNIIGSEKILAPCVKANAYGHGLVLASKVFLENGADWLSVNSLYEAKTLRENGISAAIYIMGYVGLDELEELAKMTDVRIVVYNRETIEKLRVVLEKFSKKIKVHLKAETGNNRQGLVKDELIDFAKFVLNHKNIEIEGLATHFANIEDTTDHSYAMRQLEKFLDTYDSLKEVGITVPIRHCANSAATILFPETHFEMVRAGISSYGMWPSKETKISAQQSGRNNLSLSPAFSWKTKIAQIKTIPKDEYIGYGCSYKTSHETRLAILPVGYYDGYDRKLSSAGAYVLINGKRAPIRGRVCMNISMADVTDIPEAKLEDEVVLMGGSGQEEISAELFSTWANTINYEVTTRVNERIPRILI